MIGEQKQNHKKKILASTIQFSNNTNTTTHHQQHTPAAHHSIPPGTTHVIPDTQQRNKPSPQEPSPNHNQSHTTHTGLQTHNSSHSPAKKHKNKLLRKEVIQPHLPVRLPCYDFVPIANPTFDSSLTSLGHWLRVLPTFMT